MEPVNQIPESHVKLYATATSGVPAEHSHYYRKLISAGYKGYIQGNVAGATLYGVLGGLVGAAVGVALWPVAAIGTAGFVAVPIMAGLGVMKGADTFGKIGSNAAQLAQFAETNERRRALLDLLDETPSYAEAEEIKRLLQEDTIEKPPEKLFHWKTALVGAIIGGALIAGLAALGIYGLDPHTILETVSSIGGEAVTAAEIGGHSAAAHGASTALAAGPTLGIAGAIGAGLGSMIGLDRGWIRQWFNLSETTIHDSQHYQEYSKERAHEVAKLNAISQQEMLKNGVAPSTQPTYHIPNNATSHAAHDTAFNLEHPPTALEQPQAEPLQARPERTNAPAPRISNAQMPEQSRIIQQMPNSPTV